MARLKIDQDDDGKTLITLTTQTGTHEIRTEEMLIIDLVPDAFSHGQHPDGHDEMQIRTFLIGATRFADPLSWRLWSQISTSGKVVDDEGPTRKSTYPRPHSRACGITPHDHGSQCHSNCPSCGGRNLPKTARELDPGLTKSQEVVFAGLSDSRPHSTHCPSFPHTHEADNCSRRCSTCFPNPHQLKGRGLHSAFCPVASHPHGEDCSERCPTCAGVDTTIPAYTPAEGE